MPVKFENVKIGGTITAVNWEGENRTGVVDEVSENIKNDTPWFGYASSDGSGGWWCDSDQVISHTSRRSKIMIN